MFRIHPTYLSFISWQIAIKMYKIVGEERFLLWSVCSIQLQVQPFFSLSVCACQFSREILDL